MSTGIRIVIVLRRPASRRHPDPADGAVRARHLAAAVGLAGTLAILGSTTMMTPLYAVVTIGAIAAVAVVLLLALFLPGRFVDIFVLAACGVMSLPIDKYFLAGDHIGGWLGFRIAAADLLLLVTVPILLLGRMAGQVRNVLPWSLILCYTAWLAVNAVSALFAPRFDYALMEIASSVHALLLALCVGAAFQRRLLKPLLILIACVVVLQSGFAFAQHATGRPIGAAWFGGTGVINEELVSGVVRLRPSGLLDHPIVFANMILLWVPLLAAALFIPGRWHWRTLLLAGIACGTVGLVLTLSRGAWIGMAVACITMLGLAARRGLLSTRHWRNIALSAVLAGAVLVPAFGPAFYSRITESQAGNLDVRFDLNWIALRMFQEHPGLGIGLGGFVTRMADFDPENVKKIFPAPAHNLYLLEAAEVGIFGLVLMTALFGIVVVKGIQVTARIADRSERWIAVAIVAGFIGFLVTQLADFSHRLDPLRSIIWMNIGILFALARRIPASDPKTAPAPRVTV